MKKIIIGVSGASATTYAIDLLKKTSQMPDIETHLVMSTWAKRNLSVETNLTLSEVTALANYTYDEHNQGAAIASGSFLSDGMVIVPASMKTVAGISQGYADNLIGRAADVIIKEQRKLIIVPRETPLSVIHLENLTKLAKIGVQIIPPIPAFYTQPKTIQDLLDHQTMKILDALGIKNEVAKRWQGKYKI